MAYMYNALDDLGFTQIAVPPQLRAKLLYVAFDIPVLGIKVRITFGTNY